MLIRTKGSQELAAEPTFFALKLFTLIQTIDKKQT